jgi:peptidoglycan/xylan/chitin deacetylase (PgdA/CDA1 family)
MCARFEFLPIASTRLEIIVLKTLHHHYHHIFIGLMSILAAIILGLGILAYVTFLSYTNSSTQVQTYSKPLSFSQIVNTDKRAVKTVTIVPPPTPSLVSTPDVLVPPIVNGLVPVVTTLPTKQPVVFLGIDDGAHKAADELQMMKDNHIKASLFLARSFISSNPDFFADFTTNGSLIEDHSLNHLTGAASIKSYAIQKQEICGMADYEQQHYGRRPVLFRPPGGSYSVEMRRAAADCGMKAIVTWIAKANGGSMQYQIGNHLRPGDIVLMHFRPEFKQDMRAFIDATKSQHLHTELIENWLP